MKWSCNGDPAYTMEESAKSDRGTVITLYLDDDSNEMVIKLKLTRRSTTEAFREIILSIDPSTYMIRRVNAFASSSNETYVFDFIDYKLNTPMSEQRFLYDPPTSANNYSNFLLSE